MVVLGYTRQGLGAKAQIWGNRKVGVRHHLRFLMTTGAEGVPSVLGIEFACETALQRFLSKPKAEEYNVC